MADVPTIEPSGYRHAKRLQRGSTIVGMLLQMADGRWGVYDTNENPLTRRTFETPKKARDAFVEIQSSAASEGQ